MGSEDPREAHPRETLLNTTVPAASAERRYLGDLDTRPSWSYRSAEAQIRSHTMQKEFKPTLAYARLTRRLLDYAVTRLEETFVERLVDHRGRSTHAVVTPGCIPDRIDYEAVRSITRRCRLCGGTDSCNSHIRFAAEKPIYHEDGCDVADLIEFATMLKGEHLPSEEIVNGVLGKVDKLVSWWRSRAETAEAEAAR